MNASVIEPNKVAIPVTPAAALSFMTFCHDYQDSFGTNPFLSIKKSDAGTFLVTLTEPVARYACNLINNEKEPETLPIS